MSNRVRPGRDLFLVPALLLLVSTSGPTQAQVCPACPASACAPCPSITAGVVTVVEADGVPVGPTAIASGFATAFGTSIPLQCDTDQVRIEVDSSIGQVDVLLGSPGYSPGYDFGSCAGAGVFTGTNVVIILDCASTPQASEYSHCGLGNLYFWVANGNPVSTDITVTITPNISASDPCGCAAAPPTGCTVTPIASVAPVTVFGDTSATGTNQVLFPAACGGDGDDEVFSYVAPCDSTYTLSLCNAGTTYDTSIAIYDADPCIGAPAPIGCADDSCGLQSEMLVTLTGGITYYIVVDGFGGDTGPFQLDISHVGCGVLCTPPAPNCKLCAAAFGYTAVEPDGAPATVNIATGFINSFANNVVLGVDRTSVTITATPVNPAANISILMGWPGYDRGWDFRVCANMFYQGQGPGQPVSVTYDCSSIPFTAHDLVWCTGVYAFWVQNLGATSDVRVEVTTNSSDVCGCPPTALCGGAEVTAEDVTVSIDATGSTFGTPRSYPYENDMESPAGFDTPGGAQDHRWELGVPSFGASKDHTRGAGTQCLATDLDGGVFELLGQMRTRSPWVSLPAGIANPSVSFWVYNDSGETGLGDRILGTVGIEASGAMGTILSVHPNRQVFGQFPINAGMLCAVPDTAGPAGWWYHQSGEDPTGEAGWTFVSIDLTPFVGQDVRLYWNYRNLGPDAGCFPPLCPAPGLLIDDLKVGTNVVINEIHTGDGAGDGTWIELFNMGPTTVDLAGWRLVVDDGTSTTVTVLPTHPLRTYHGAVIIEGASPFGVDQTWTHIYNQLVTAMSIGSGGAVILEDPAGRAVDFVRWGGNTTAVPAGMLWEEGTPLGNPTLTVNNVARSRTAVDTGAAADFDTANGPDSATATPAFDNDDTTPLEIVSVSLKPGSVGAAYIDKMEAIGGTPPYTWSLVSGFWPALNPPASMGPAAATGVVSSGAGTIALGQEGNFNLVLRVTDSLGAMDDQPVVLTIGPLTPDMMAHTVNAPDTGSGYTIDWQFRDTSSSETGFVIRDATSIVVSSIGPSCPAATTGSLVPAGGCHLPGATQETGLTENVQVTRSAHSIQTLPSIIQGVVINELDLGQNDMVELFNYSASAVDLSNWQIQLHIDNPSGVGMPCGCGTRIFCNTYTFPGGTMLASGAAVRVYDNGNPAQDTTTVKNAGVNWQPVSSSQMNVALVDNTLAVVDLVKINADYTCGAGAGVFTGFITSNGVNKMQRIVDPDNDDAADWRVEVAAGTPGSLNPGQAGLIIFNAESIIVDPTVNEATAYSSVHDPVVTDIGFGAIADTSITVNISQPPGATADNTGIQVEWFLDANSNGMLDGAEASAPLAAWMSPNEGGSYLDPTNWANAYSHAHSGLAQATDYCYRFRYRNGDGLPAGPGDITSWSPWSCAVTTSSCLLGAYACGDCNGNLFNDITDSLKMAQIAVGLATMPAYASNEFNACNVNGQVPPSGGADISIIDALWNARFIVGLVTMACCAP